jgi:hypothetical protein
MEPEPKPETMGDAPYDQFGFGVFAANGGHALAALRGGERVGHRSYSSLGMLPNFLARNL